MLYHNMDSNCMQNSNGHAVCCSFQDEVYAGYVYAYVNCLIKGQMAIQMHKYFPFN